MSHKDPMRRTEYHREYMRKYRKKYPDRQWNSEGYVKRLRIRALSIIGMGNIICNNCGCDELDIMEINHINGGGNKEKNTSYKNANKKFYRDIIFGRRKIDDLNILCKICNALHYVETIKGINGFRIIWNGMAV